MDKYPDYREVSSDWIHTVPSHWKEETLIQVAENQQIKNKGMVERNLLSLSYGKIIQKDINRTDGLLPASFEGYQIVQNGNIILRLTDLQNDHKSLRTGLVTQTGIITSAYTCLKVRGGILPAYLHLLLHSADLHKVFYGMGGGVRQSIGYKDIRYMPIIVPPIKEQEQIVRFLDWKISSINRLILSWKKKIALLEELRDKQFRIVQNTSNKRVRIKQLFKLETEWIDVTDECLYSKVGMYNRGRGIFLREPINGKDLGDSKFQVVHSNCVMLSGQFAWEGAVYITQFKDTDGVASHRYYQLKASSYVPVEYLFAFLLSDYGAMLLNKCSHGAAGRNRPLNIQELLNEYIPVPTIDNNLSVLVQIVHQCMQARNQSPRQLEIGSELKASLISDVVTGKVDVRNVVIPEYEYTSEEGSADGVDDEELEEEENDNV